MPPSKDLFTRKCILIMLVIVIICATMIAIACILKPQPPEPKKTKPPPNNQPLTGSVPEIQLNEKEILNCIVNAGFRNPPNHTYYIHVATCENLARLRNSLLEKGEDLPKWSKVNKSRIIVIDDYEWQDTRLLIKKITSASESLCQVSSDPTKPPTVPPLVKVSSDPTEPSTAPPHVKESSNATKQPTVASSVQVSSDPTEPSTAPPHDKESSNATKQPTVASSVQVSSDPTEPSTAPPHDKESSNATKQPTVASSVQESSNATKQPTVASSVQVSSDPTKPSTAQPLVKESSNATKQPTVASSVQVSSDPTEPSTAPPHVKSPMISTQNNQQILNITESIQRHTEAEIVKYLENEGYQPVSTEKYQTNASCENLSKLDNWLTGKKEKIPPWAHLTKLMEVTIGVYEWKNFGLLVQKIEGARRYACENQPYSLTFLSDYNFKRTEKHLFKGHMNCSDFAKVLTELYKPAKNRSNSPVISNGTWMVFHEFELLNASQVIERLEWVSERICQPLPEYVEKNLKQGGAQVNGSVLQFGTMKCSEFAKSFEAITGKMSETNNKSSITIPDVVLENLPKLREIFETEYLQQCKLDSTALEEIFVGSNFTKPDGRNYYTRQASCHDLLKVINKLTNQYDPPEWGDVTETTDCAVGGHALTDLDLVIHILTSATSDLSECEPDFFKYLEKNGFQKTDHGIYEANASCDNLYKWLHGVDRTREDRPNLSEANNKTRMAILGMEWSNKSQVIQRLQWMNNKLCEVSSDSTKPPTAPPLVEGSLPSTPNNEQNSTKSESIQDASKLPTASASQSSEHPGRKKRSVREVTPPRPSEPLEIRQILEAAHFHSDDSITYTNDASCHDLAQLLKNLRNSDEDLPEWSQIEEWHEISIQNYEWNNQDLLINKIEAASDSFCKVWQHYSGLIL